MKVTRREALNIASNIIITAEQERMDVEEDEAKKGVQSSIICDKCGVEVFANDPMELQEFHHVNFVGGYGSVFGDEAWVQCDLCQNCLMELIGDYCRCEEIGND